MRIRIRNAYEVFMMQSDKEFVRECLNGHPNQFRHLVQRYQGPLVAYLTGQLGSRDRAEEAAQETFVRAYFNLKKLNQPEKFYSWLIGTGQRVAQEQHRHQHKQRELVKQAMETKPAVEMSAEYSLEHAIGELPETFREVILLRYYSGLSCKETAMQLELPLGTVTKRLSQAYRMLRETLQAQRQTEVNP